jgi:hypothetical protein
VSVARGETEEAYESSSHDAHDCVAAAQDCVVDAIVCRDLVSLQDRVHTVCLYSDVMAVGNTIEKDLSPCPNGGDPGSSNPTQAGPINAVKITMPTCVENQVC